LKQNQVWWRRVLEQVIFKDVQRRFPRGDRKALWKLEASQAGKSDLPAEKDSEATMLPDTFPKLPENE